MPFRAPFRRITLASVLAFVFAGASEAATLYGIATGSLGNSTSLFVIDDASGTAVEGVTLHDAGGSTNQIYNGGLAYDPYQNRLYAMGCSNENVAELYLVNPVTGAVDVIGPLGVEPGMNACFGGLTFDVTKGRLFATALSLDPYTAATVLLELNPSTGHASTIGVAGPRGTQLYGLGCDPRTGVLYANGYTDFAQQSLLFTVDKATGVASLVGPHGLSFGRRMNYSGLAFRPGTNEMFGIGNCSSSASNLYSVNKVSGTATPVGACGALAMTVDGAAVYVGSDVLLDASSPVRGFVPLRSWPSPTHGPVTFAFTLEREATVSLSVFDVAGRAIARLAPGTLALGGHTIAWNGRTDSGTPAEPGTYFAVLRADGERRGTCTLVVAR